MENIEQQPKIEGENKINKQGTEREKVNLKMFAYGFIALVVLTIIIMGAIGSYRVYAKVANDTFTVTVAKILRLPAAKLDDQVILYKDYIMDVEALKIYRTYVTKNAEASGQVVNITDKQISQDAMFRLIDNILVNKLTTQYGVSYEKSEIDTAKADILSQFTTTAEAEAEIRRMFGWDFDTYTKRIIIPGVLKSNLQKKMKDISKSEGEKVLTQIKGGADFAVLAKQYGADATKNSGGDLGWFGSGEMVPAFETAVQALKKDELASSLVETNYGYHIVKQTDSRMVTSTATSTASAGTSVLQYRASHILFPLDVNYYLDKEVRKVKFKLYINIDNPLNAILNPTQTETETETETTSTTS